jgi:ACS family hexuronate transporter-like MFS transporter
MSAATVTVPKTHGYTQRTRWVILALLFAITVVNFVDRQTLSVLAPVVRQNLHLSNEAYGRIVSAFQFGMMTGELPMGALMDRLGVRVVLAGAVLWWSGATSAQAIAKSGVQLGLARFWMGTGECGNYSGGIKVLTQLFRKENRTLAIGIFNSGSMVGSTIAPPIIVWLLQRHGYRSAFLVAASLGLLWVPMWWLVYRNPSAAKELHVVESKRTAWELFTHRSVWAVMMCRFFVGPVMQFYWYWIPNYLFHERHVSMSGIGFVAWIPFVLGDVGGVAGGWSANLLQRRGLQIYSVRKITMILSALVCVASLFVPMAKGLLAAYLLIGLAMMADNFLSANMFGAITDLFPENEVGRVTGFTGLSAGLSGLLFPLLTGYLVDHVSYTPVFLLIGVMPIFGAAALFVLGAPAYRKSQEAL